MTNPEREPHWLDLMTGYLDWRIVPPDLTSPFAPQISYPIMCELAHSKDALAKLFQIKCFCDGYEVLHIKNLYNPMICTDHPSLAKMHPDHILDYLREKGIVTKVDKALEELQQYLIEKINVLEVEMKQQPGDALKHLIKTKGRVKRSDGGGVFRYRMVKR